MADDAVTQAVMADPRSSVEIEDVAASIPKGSPNVSAKIYFDNAIPGARKAAGRDVVESYNTICGDTRGGGE